MILCPIIAHYLSPTDPLTMSFKKPFKIATQNVKTTAQQAIKNGMSFSCQLANICATSGENIVYPESSNVRDWMVSLFTKNLKPKKIPEKALAAMKARGIEPKKNPSEVLLIAVVVGSNTHVHVGISVPSDNDNHQSLNVDPSEFARSFMGERKYEETQDENYLIIQYDAEFPFKEKDTIHRLIFDELRKRGILTDEQDSDDEVFFDLNDI